MSKNHFVLATVEALPGYRLRLTYADGQTVLVDLSERIRTMSFLAPLKDAALFAQAKRLVSSLSLAPFLAFSLMCYHQSRSKGRVFMTTMISEVFEACRCVRRKGA